MDNQLNPYQPNPDLDQANSAQPPLDPNSGQTSPNPDLEPAVDSENQYQGTPPRVLSPTSNSPTASSDSSPDYQDSLTNNQPAQPAPSSYPTLDQVNTVKQPDNMPVEYQSPPAETGTEPSQYQGPDPSQLEAAKQARAEIDALIASTQEEVTSKLASESPEAPIVPAPDIISAQTMDDSDNFYSTNEPPLLELPQIHTFKRRSSEEPPVITAISSDQTAQAVPGENIYNGTTANQTPNLQGPAQPTNDQPEDQSSSEDLGSVAEAKPVSEFKLPNADPDATITEDNSLQPAPAPAPEIIQTQVQQTSTPITPETEKETAKRLASTFQLPTDSGLPSSETATATAPLAVVRPAQASAPSPAISGDGGNGSGLLAKLKTINYKPFVSAAFAGIIVFAIFNAQVILGQVQYLTTPSGGLDTPGGNINSTAPAGDVQKIIIPRINVDVPVVYDVKTFEEKAVQKGLERGVVHYGSTALPGENGNNVIVGHSSNNWWEPGDYKFAFVLLDKLEKGDEIILHYKGTRYVYEVNKKFITEPNDVSVLNDTDDATLTLITCTPPGTSWQRLIVTAKQISPDPNQNKTMDNTQKTELETLPSDASSSFSGILRNLFQP